MGRGANGAGRAAPRGGVVFGGTAGRIGGVTIGRRGAAGRPGVIPGARGVGGEAAATGGGTTGTGADALGGVAGRAGTATALATSLPAWLAIWFAAWRAAGANSSWIELPPPVPMVITPPQTAHRARTPDDGIFAGSTRKTDRHSGQETFTNPPPMQSSRSRAAVSPEPFPRIARRSADRSKRPIRVASSRSSSSRLRARSPAPRG